MLNFIHSSKAFYSSQKNHCYLHDDFWDDFGLKTSFYLEVVDSEGRRYKVGTVKIMRRGITEGRTELPASFNFLDEDYCSLGQDQNYYEQLNFLPEGMKEEILTGLRDCASNNVIFKDFSLEQPFRSSLLRQLSSSKSVENFRNIILGQAIQSKFYFSFTNNYSSDSKKSYVIDFQVIPKSLPPTNVHAIIGRNGVGKTRFLSKLANTITKFEYSVSQALQSDLQFLDDHHEYERFSNLVTVAFSAFDSFEPLKRDKISGEIRYSYVGLKQEDASSSTDGSDVTYFKTMRMLVDEFSKSLSECLTGPRRIRWKETISILNSDPGFAELALEQLAIEDPKGIDAAKEAFRNLSSGHKIVLLSVTRLVELVDEKTLVLIDEPESHLHPPLLSSFIRALSNLLTNRNGVALVATHSPVVLQEIPKSCTWIIRRIGDSILVERPQMETFGESIGTLTEEVFQLEVSKSGYSRMISEELEDKNYDELISEFDGQIGSEGRALARILDISKNQESGE